MRILMLGNSLTSAQDMPDILAELTGAEVVCHTPVSYTHLTLPTSDLMWCCRK